MGRDWRARRPRQSDSEEEEEETEDPTLSLMENEGPTSRSVLSEPRGSSAIDEQSLMIAELAEPSQEDEELGRRFQELRRRNQELKKIVAEGVITGTVIVENSGAGDHDQNAASSPFGRKERRLLIGAVFALLLVVGVILGVTIPLTTNNDSAVTPTQSPTPTEAPTEALTEAPTPGLQSGPNVGNLYAAGMIFDPSAGSTGGDINDVYGGSV
jgi:hypothetical protein